MHYLRLTSKKKQLYGLLTLSLLALAVVALVTLTGSRPTPHLHDASDELSFTFAQLSNTHTNYCAGPSILDTATTDRLQGACCGAMDFHRYVEQIQGLKKYASINVIPADPYDIPVTLAEQLLDYQRTITLTPQQQAVYDAAVQRSHEGGPCCCTCWRWYAFEGLAKYLITEHDFDAEQIADVWDLEDGCGGEGHAHA